MKEPIAWKDRNKSQAVLHCSSCYLLWYGVVGRVRGDDEQPRLPAALCSRAAGLLPFPPSSLPPPGAQTASPLHVHFSFWLYDLKAAGGTIGALRAAKGQPELGRSPQAAAVMADVRPAGPEGGGNGDGALPARGRVWRRTRELYHDILTAFGKEKIPQQALWRGLLQRWVCRRRGQAGRWLRAGSSYVQWLGYGKVRFSQSSTLLGSAQTNISHVWNKDVYVLILACFGVFFPNVHSPMGELS